VGLNLLWYMNDTCILMCFPVVISVDSRLSNGFNDSLIHPAFGVSTAFRPVDKGRSVASKIPVGIPFIAPVGLALDRSDGGKKNRHGTPQSHIIHFATHESKAIPIFGFLQ
jgi:hypothetical protein